jgi:hypothetical protein
MLKSKIIILFYIFWSTFFGQSLLAYQSDVHSLINSAAVSNSNFHYYLMYKLGVVRGADTEIALGRLKKEIGVWIAYGGTFEDSGARWLNHFHDPLKGWGQAGLLGMSPSSILWGADAGMGNACSWDSARRYYYTYLTGKDAYGNVLANSQAMREAYFARCLQSVGQVMHLLQDASVPLHTRDDAHVLPVFFAGDVVAGTYETYTKINILNLDYVPDQTGNQPSPLLLTDPQPESNYTGLAPITGLFDRNQYNGDAIPARAAATGLAEYANANFLTQDTIWEYPHPAQSDLDCDPGVWLNPEEVDAEDGVRDNRIYFGTSVGDPVRHLVAASYWYYRLYMWNKPELRYAYILDEKCFADYAAKLVPRAVGYSAELLDYFFRGGMEITLPQEGYYAMTSDPENGFDRVKLKVKNTTANHEEMTDGSIELVVKYRLSRGEPFTNNYSDTTWEFFYITASEAGQVRSIPGNEFVELTFDLGRTPIPLWATDVYLEVVYKGRLGNEREAVAVGFKDIGEPTPLDLFSNFDKICLFGEWQNTGPEAVGIVDDPANGGDGNGRGDEWDVYPHNLKDTYYLFSPGGVVRNPDPDQGRYHYHIPLLEPGQLHRGPYILADYPSFIFTYLTSAEPLDPDDPFGHGKMAGLSVKPVIKNQIEWNAYYNGYVRYMPNFAVFRGVETWRSFTVLYPQPYPGPDHPCSFWDIP